MKYMHALLFALCGLFVILADHAIVFAQASLPVVDAGGAVSGLLAAFKSHSWSLVASFGLMLVVWGAGKFNLLSMLPAKAVPWVSIALGAAAAAATSITTGHPIGESLATGVEAGLAGVGAWETVGKNVLPSAAPTDPAKPS